MTARRTYAALAVVLAMIAIAMPTEWYATIPRFSDVRLPFSGVTLLRSMFGLEAILVAVLAALGTRFVRHAAIDGRFQVRSGNDFDVGRRTAIAVLVAITVLGLWLRVHGLGHGLWLDEVSPLFDYRHLSAAQVMGSYLRSNNHLLNTLLVKAAISAFGETESSVRLPAVLFGVLTIPGLYWFARFGLSRIASLCSALLLAVSYHHVFFSQNARGYTAYLLFAILSTGFLLRALRDDRLWQWALYVTFIVLGMASLLLTAFVAVGHALLSAIVVWRVHRTGARTGNMVRRIAAVFATAAVMAFQIYAAAVPEAYVTLTSLYTEPATGFSLFSSDLAHEVLRGLVAGFGSPVVVLVALVAGLIGYGALIRLSWPLAVSLVLPPILTVILLITRGLTLSPRFFLLAVPLAMVSAAAALQVGAEWLRGRGVSRRYAQMVFAGSLAAIALASARSLPYYYRVPKQSYQAAIAFLEGRETRGTVFVVGNAELGTKYYLERLRPPDSAMFIYTRDAAQLNGSNTSDVRAITTFSRALRIDYPAIDSELRTNWQRDTTFSATVGDGEITVWSKNPQSPLANRL